MFQTRPVFVFDWDGVLANQDELHRIAADIFALAGVPEQTERATYDRILGAGGYNFRRQLQEVLRHHPHLIPSAGTLHRTFTDSLERLSQPVYPDVYQFIQRLRDRYRVALLVAGDSEFEQQKIQRSGLASSVSQMLFVPRNREVGAAKARALGQLLELYPSVIYFDDEPEALAAVHDTHAHHQRVVSFRVDRSQKQTARYSHAIRSFADPLPPLLERLLTAP